ncbi:hypothetical protein [Nocardia jejuensis]|uniref:hypothetical protein n=1 Tax=Nocardia jejuensis TaxID=328049 RepID=UPI000AE181FB|nr:hypothetical protein [Nocardia jejuensis]
MDSPRVEFELAVRRLSGPLVPGRHPRFSIVVASQAPAFLLIVPLLIVPTGYTLWLGADARPWLAAGCALLLIAAVAAPRAIRSARGSALGVHGTYWGLARSATWAIMPVLSVSALAALGSALIAVDLPPEGRSAYVGTGVSVLVAAALVVIALWFAWRTRYLRWPWRMLVVPFGMSALTSGVAFRLIFVRLTENRDLGSVATYRWAFVVTLVLSFAWTWFGLLVGLFRAAILAIEDDSVRAGELYDETGPRLAWRLLRLLRPMRLIAFLVVGVAAARIFDAVLVTVPRSMQYGIDTATVFWWRSLVTCDPNCGDAAAYTLPLAVVIGVAALWAQSGIRAHQTSWSGPGVAPPDTGRETFGVRGFVWLVLPFVFTVGPIAMLVWVALTDSHRSVADRFAAIVRDSALWHALGTTACVAGLATALVVGVSVPVAHRLAALRTESAGWIVVPTLVILTVMPAQMYLGPLHDVINHFGWSGTRIPLILTHAAAGLPISILILRGALLAPAYTPAADALYGLAPRGTIMTRVFTAVRPALGAVAVLEFVQVWNDFFIGLLIGGPGASPWSLLIWGYARQFDENTAQLASGALVSAVVPVILLLACWRRWLVPGLAGGALR